MARKKSAAPAAPEYLTSTQVRERLGVSAQMLRVTDLAHGGATVVEAGSGVI